MPLEKRQENPEGKYKSWVYDPELIENLVLMLEEKAIDPKTGKEGWKYGSGHAFRALFPSERTPWATPYKGTPVPASQLSFRVVLKNLETGIRRFGPEIPQQLIDRFIHVMKARTGSHPIEQETLFWDNPRKLIAAGLVDYCGFTDRQALAFMKDKFGYDAASPRSLGDRRSFWRTRHEFPYENGTSLRLNSPLMISFVDYLHALAGVTPQGLRGLVLQTHGRDSVYAERIEHFIEVYGKYKKKWRSGAQANTSK